jgi:hypothetical protein
VLSALALVLAGCVTPPGSEPPPGAPSATPADAPTAAATATSRSPVGTPVPVETTPPALAGSPTPRADEPVTITVYFTDRKRYEQNEQPFEVPVTRTVAPGSDLLEAFFAGPTDDEEEAGLDAVLSGFTGLERLEVADGIARVYLEGECSSGGATYTIAQPLIANLTQFDEIRYVKIYDAEGTTEQPEGETNSIPFCLEP